MSADASTDVAILGGGVAGISAALACSDAGASVTLLEVRPRLGGAAYSVRRDGLTVDNGQHVFLRRCDAYRALLARLRSEHLVQVQRRLEIPVLRAGAEPSVLRRDNLPPPAHLARAMLSFAPLAPRQRLSAAVAVRALASVDPDDPRNDASTFGQWLARHGQSDGAVAALWDLVILPTLNVRAQEASLALAAFVFQEGLLNSTDGGDIGFHTGSLSQVIGEPALSALGAAGVHVRLRWRAERVLARLSSSSDRELPAGGGRAAATGAGRAGSGGGRAGSGGGRAGSGGGRAGSGGGRAGSGGGTFVVEGRSGRQRERVHSDAVIDALPHLRAAEVLPPQADAIAQRLRRIGVSPIVNLHVLYDRRVCELPFAASVQSPVQYLFDRSEAGGARDGEQYLAVSLSCADVEMEQSVQRLRERYVPAIAELLPDARRARVKSFLVTREHAATFRATPGIAALRPAARTGIAGLALAGAYTATRWPATLEGAARSGASAAQAALEDLGERAGRIAGARTLDVLPTLRGAA
ncbi:MAG: hydroxysqualene dehydroxylase [Solirubrobacteraceae bacterium]